jgi:peptide/nickel transport system ATP-binding protein
MRSPSSQAPPLLRVRDLLTSFETPTGHLRAVDGVSFDVPEGKTLGIVGESGCGKSMTALSILRLVPEPAGHIESGSILFRGKDLLKVSRSEMRSIRGNQISMIFQEPMTSLNPVYTAGDQIAEAVRLHQKKSREGARVRALEMLRLVGIPAPETNIDAYPHQLSGGMRQRVMIAMALACEPSLLIADEPTTALDVTIQAQILTTLANLQSKLKMSILLITHDLGVVAEYTDDVVVMYAGRVVEQASVQDLFARPRHPYTKGLLGSTPRGVLPSRISAPPSVRDAGDRDPAVPPVDERPPPSREGPRARLRTIEGMVPDLRDLPPGCRFADRCPMVLPECSAREPDLLEVESTATVDASGGRPPYDRGDAGAAVVPHLSRCLRAGEL